MRILYLSNVLSIHDHRFLSSLVSNGYEVYLLTFKEIVPKFIQDIPELEIIHRPLFRGEIRGNKYISGIQKEGKLSLFCFYNFMKRAATSLQNKLSFNIMENISAILSLWRVYQTKITIKKVKPDVLHTVWVPGGGLIGALSCFHPVLLMPLASDILVFPNGSLVWRYLTGFIIRTADMITCDCERVKREIIKQTGFPSEKIVVFPRGVDLETFHPDEDLRWETRKSLGWLDNKIIIMTRSFAPIYGVEYFLRSIPEVIRSVPHARVLLVGSGPMEMFFKKLVKELGLVDIVRFHGPVPNEALPSLLNAADVYVSSSLSDGTSVSLLEAMACGLPVVVSDIPSNLEWISNGSNGLIYPRHDHMSLAESIIVLLRNEQLAAKMRKKNLEIAKRRANWRRNFKLLEKMYEDLIKSQNLYQDKN